MRFRATLIVGLMLALLQTVVGMAEESQLSEYRVKAAFVFNFAKFVEWTGQRGREADLDRISCLDAATHIR